MLNQLPLPSLFSGRSRHYAPSPIRAVFDLELRPGTISLAGGNPDLSLLPWSEIANSVSRIINQDGKYALQYGTTTGRPELAALIAKVMAEEGIEADPREIIVTTGSQMSLELISKLFIDPGDIVFCAAPTYPGALHAFASMEAHVIQLPGDSQGISPQALRTALSVAKASGRKAKLLYLIPSFANPDGATMPEKRRIAVAQICREFGIPIVEDNPYGLINFEGLGSAPPTLRMIDPANVIYLGSLSKIFSPGIRIGWADAPTAVHASLVPAAESTAICPSVLSQFIAEAYLRDLDWRSILAEGTAGYRRRAKALLRGLGDFMPEGVTWTTPRGGFFIWVSVPESLDTSALLEEAIEEGLVYIPGAAFYIESRGHHELRLSYSLESEDDLYEGARRLGKVLRRGLNLAA